MLTSLSVGHGLRVFPASRVAVTPYRPRRGGLPTGVSSLNRRGVGPTAAFLHLLDTSVPLLKSQKAHNFQQRASPAGKGRPILHTSKGWILHRCTEASYTPDKTDIQETYPYCSLAHAERESNAPATA